MKNLLCRFLGHQWRISHVVNFDQPITVPPGGTVHLEVNLSDFTVAYRCSRCGTLKPLPEEILS